MKTMRTWSESVTALNLKPGGSYRLKQDMSYKSGVIPAGTRLDVFFSDKYPSFLYFQYGTDNAKRTGMVRANRYFSGFRAMPSRTTLERWEYDGVCLTPTGKRTEPDGYGDDNSPSWLLVLGLI